MTQVGRVAILSSETGEERSFVPVKPEEVPEWVKSEEVISQLIAGEQARQSGGFWYAALLLEESPLLIDSPRLGIKRK